MPTPTVTFRIPPEQQEAVRAVVSAIKDDPRLAEAVLDFIRTRSDGGANVGPFRDEAAALSFLVGRLAAALKPEAVFLFGSRAVGAARPDSDFDLLVVLADGQGDPDPYAAYAPVAGCGVGADVVPCRMADFLAERERAGTIAATADRDGRLLYARPGGPFRERYRRQRKGA